MKPKLIKGKSSTKIRKKYTKKIYEKNIRKKYTKKINEKNIRKKYTKKNIRKQIGGTGNLEIYFLDDVEVMKYKYEQSDKSERKIQEIIEIFPTYYYEDINLNELFNVYLQAGPEKWKQSSTNIFLEFNAKYYINPENINRNDRIKVSGYWAYDSYQIKLIRDNISIVLKYWKDIMTIINPVNDINLQIWQGNTMQYEKYTEYLKFIALRQCDSGIKKIIILLGCSTDKIAEELNRFINTTNCKIFFIGIARSQHNLLIDIINCNKGASQYTINDNMYPNFMEAIKYFKDEMATRDCFVITRESIIIHLTEIAKIITNKTISSNNYIKKFSHFSISNATKIVPIANRVIPRTSDYMSSDEDEE